MGEQKLTFEEYTTILTQLEACLNTRPLCALTENIDDLDILTPAHFLIGRAGLTVIETKEDARKRWHLCQKLFQDIWKTWRTEYLSQLTVRPKWKMPQQNIKIGDLVTIAEDNLPPGKWALGRVVETHMGNDGYIRVVTLKTKQGLLKRPVVKLSILPVQNETDNGQESSNQHINKDKNHIKKHRSHFTTMLLIILYFMSMLTSGLCFQATKLNNDQGLYFDRIANVQLIRDEWKLVAYYDMNPYWQGSTAVRQYSEHIENICKTIKHVTHCEIIILQLQHAFNELEHYNKILLKHKLSARARKRRGLINGVGYLAHSLFGVLDDDFAEQYQKDINLVRINEKHLENLWRNQTSIVEAEYNLLKRTEANMQKQHKMINQHLINLEIATNALSKQMSYGEQVSEFTISSMSATNLINHLRNIQDTLIDTITSVYNGRINIHLIDPQQLQEQLNIISGQLPKELTLPIDNIQTNTANIYHLLKVKARITDQYLIFEIKIPLINRESYDLYSVYSIPHIQDNNMITILPIENHVAINIQKDSYIPIPYKDLEQCIQHVSPTYLCQFKSPVYHMKSSKNLCIKDDKETEKCKTKVSTCQNKFISLRKTNQYLHFCCKQCKILILCNEQVNVHQLSGTNIINIEQGCLVKTENYTVYTHKHQESRVDIKYNIETPVVAPINHLMNITVDKVAIMDDAQSNTTHEQLRKLGKQIEVMKNSKGLSDNITIHDVHHYILIWGIWIVVGIAAIIFLYRRYCVRQQPKTGPESIAMEEVVSPPAAVRRATRVVRECCEAREPSDSGIMKAHRHKDKSTTPVLRKISFSDN